MCVPPPVSSTSWCLSQSVGVVSLTLPSWRSSIFALRSARELSIYVISRARTRIFRKLLLQIVPSKPAHTRTCRSCKPSFRFSLFPYLYIITCCSKKQNCHQHCRNLSRFSSADSYLGTILCCVRDHLSTSVLYASMILSSIYVLYHALDRTWVPALSWVCVISVPACIIQVYHSKTLSSKHFFPSSRAGTFINMYNLLSFFLSLYRLRWVNSAPWNRCASRSLRQQVLSKELTLYDNYEKKTTSTCSHTPINSSDVYCPFVSF